GVHQRHFYRSTAMRFSQTRLGTILMLTGIILCTPQKPVTAHEPHVCPEGIHDGPALAGHVAQADIVSGRLTFEDIVDAGATRFTTVFNICDGQGRPVATGAATPTKRLPDQPAMIRTSAPDSNSCAGCHNQPRVGGGGDFVANVFVLAQTL